MAMLEATKTSERGRSLSGAAKTAVDSSHGLPSNQIHEIDIDHLSRLWLAGPAGLSCFDGSTVHNFDRRSGLKCNGLRTIGVGLDDTLWVGTDLGLEALGPDARPLPWSARFAWPFGLCEHLNASGAVIWVGAAQGLVRLEQASSQSPPLIALHADAGFVRHIARVSDSHIFAASDTLGLVECQGNSWNPVRCPELAGCRVSQLGYGPGSNLLVGTEKGLHIMNAETKEITARLVPPGAEPIVTAIARGEHEWWIAFRNELVAYPFDDPASGETERYHLDSLINDLTVDEWGNVWIATDTAGLAVVSCLRRAVRRVDIGQPGAVFSIKPGPDDSLYVGGEKLFGKLSPATDPDGSRLRGPAGLPATTVWDSHADSSGLWAATHEGLYHARPGGDFARVFADDPVLGAPARVLFPRQDELWVGTLRGLSRIRDGSATEVLPADGKPLGYVYAVQVDDAATLWVATLGRGLWREDGQLKPVVAGPLSASGNTYAVATGPSGDTIVLQDEKVILLDRSLSPRLVEEYHPISGWTALWLDHQTVAIGSSDGLRLLNIATATVTTRIQSLLGARAWEFTNNRTLVRDGPGRLLCGVNAGLVRVDLLELRRFAKPPRTRLLDIDWHGTVPEKCGNEFRIRPGRWSVRVRAFTAWLVEHEQLTFRFKLVGFDDAWSMQQKNPDTVYTSLPAGEYELLCQAHSPLTGFGPPESLCKLRVGTPWWALGWTSALAAVESVFDRLVRSRARNRLLLERNDLLEAEVKERTAELRAVNDRLAEANEELQRLSTTDPLTHLRNRRFFDHVLATEWKRQSRAAGPLSILLVDVDHFKSINDNYGHPFGDECLIAIGKAIASVVRRPSDVAARYGGEEFVILLPNTPKDAAMRLAEKIRETIQSQKLGCNGVEVRLTASIGVGTAESPHGTTQQAVLKAADDALYRAKAGGRNRVEG